MRRSSPSRLASCVGVSQSPPPPDDKRLKQANAALAHLLNKGIPPVNITASGAVTRQAGALINLQLTSHCKECPRAGLGIGQNRSKSDSCETRRRLLSYAPWPTPKPPPSPQRFPPTCPPCRIPLVSTPFHSRFVSLRRCCPIANAACHLRRQPQNCLAVDGIAAKPLKPRLGRRAPIPHLLVAQFHLLRLCRSGHFPCSRCCPFLLPGRRRDSRRAPLFPFCHFAYT
jgi:hypothetical protein